MNCLGRWLFASASRRTPFAPEVPTFKELGYPALQVSAWFGLYTRAGTRPELVARYNELIVQAMRTPAVREKMRGLELEIREMTPAEIATMLKTDYDRWGPVVKASGFKAD